MESKWKMTSVTPECHQVLDKLSKKTGIKMYRIIESALKEYVENHKILEINLNQEINHDN